MTLVLLTVAAQAADLLGFALVAERRGLGSEANALMVAIVTAAGLGTAAAVKAVGAAVLGLLAWRLRHRRVRLLPATAGLVGAASAVAVLA